MGQRVLPFLVSAAVFLLDRITKNLVRADISLWDAPVVVIPGFCNIVHTENPGIAFGLLANLVNPWRQVLLVGFSIAVLAIISAVLLRAGAGSSPTGLLRFGLCLVMGGALGNLFDRIVHGTVTDFVQVYAGQHYFPDFNMADSAITIGAGLLLLDLWKTRHHRE